MKSCCLPKGNFIGTIDSINTDLITIILTGGGSISFRSAYYARTMTEGNRVWIESSNGEWQLTQAPTMPAYNLDV